MNTYRYVFSAKCPSDEETIIYGLEVRSKEMIRVETIKSACSEWTTGFQEDIARDLCDVLGASISLRAQHQGVEILTELDAPTKGAPRG